MSESDSELIERCKNGDMSAFDQIVQRYEVPLLNFIIRYIGDPESAEDLTQETFIRIYKNVKRYRKDKAEFRTWMYRIAANLCKNELRNRGRRSRIMVNSVSADDDSGDAIENAVDTTAGPDRQLEEKERQELLSQAISSLPDKLRTALILRDVQGMSYEEVSEIVGKPLGTVKSRINRARLMLKDRMAEYAQP